MGVQDEMARSLRIPPERLFNIPNPLDRDRGLADPACAVRAASLPEGFVLFVGRLDLHTKGLDVLLEAWAQVPTPRSPLVLLGDGPDRPWVAGEILRLGLEDVQDLGWQCDPGPFYRRAGLAVVSSRFEGWSNAMMEAMGQGCPVVATDCPYGPAEILGPEHQSLLSPVEDAAALAANIARVLRLPEGERHVLGRALQTRAWTFAAPRVASRWVDLARGLRARR